MLDVVILLLFIAYSLSMGFRQRKSAGRSLEHYFLANKSVAGWRAGLSMAATQYAADTPLLVTGLVATGGLFMLWRFWIYGFGYLLIAFIFAECWRRANVLTDAELTEVRYSGRATPLLRAFKAIYYGTVVNCFFLAMVLVATVRIAEVFLPWHEWLPNVVYDAIASGLAPFADVMPVGVTDLDPQIAATNGLISIVVMTLFIFSYSTLGGLHAVIATDVLQFCFMMIGTACYAWVLVAEAGGMLELGARVQELYGTVASRELLAPFPAGEQLVTPFVVIVALQGLFWISSDGTGYLAQRCMACQTHHDARIAGVVFTWAQILGRSLLWSVIAVALLVVYPFEQADRATSGFVVAREMTFVYGIEDLMPPGLRGVMLTGLLAALASTMDTHLNWGASYWSKDLYEDFICKMWLKRAPQGRELALVARLSNLIILSIALVIMLNLGSIQATWMVSLVFGAGIGGVLMLRWLWQRINVYSEIASIASATVAAPILLTQIDSEWLQLSVMVVVSTSAAVVVTFFTPSTESATVEAFIQRVDPPGYWGDQQGRARQRDLLRRLSWASCMAGSIWCLLLGIQRLLMPLPGSNPLWSWLILSAAAVFVPFWLPALRERSYRG